MRHPLRFAAPLLSLLLLAAVAAAPPRAERWVCPPCGSPCDTLSFDHAGTCPQCGMALVTVEEAARAAAAAPPAKKVAVLVFNGVEIIDYTGPWEMFGADGYDVYTVAASKEPVTTAMGMTVVPRYTFADAPPPDVLLVPGGGIAAARHDAATLAWVRSESARATITFSVCNGAFILADAGLLDGLSATTTYGNLGRLRTEHPKVHVVDDRRFVDNGRIVTAAGLTAGIDGALHVLARVQGEGEAQQVALSEEYDWRPAAGFARGRLADRLIPNLDDADLGGSGHWLVTRTEGDDRHWEMVASGPSRLSAPELLDRIGRALAAKGKGEWTKRGGASRAGAPLASDWSVRGRNGRPWAATLSVRPETGGSGRYTVTLTLARAG